CAGHLVVPALFARVECGPDEADQENEGADQIPDVASDRPSEADLAPGGRIDHVEAEHSLPERRTERGPHHREIDELHNERDQVEVLDRTVAEGAAARRVRTGCVDAVDIA